MIRKFSDDGMQHHYSTCPRCRCIVSNENLVEVDGKAMCRQCLKELSDKAKRGDDDTALAVVGTL